MHGVEVVPEKKKAEDPIRFNDRRPLARMLAPAMLGKASHHPEDETRIEESREIEPQRHVEYRGYRQEDETRRDQVPKPEAEVLSQGHLALVDNKVDQASGTISMKATFDNTDNVLWPGLSVSTRLLVETLKHVTVVPEDSVQQGPSGLYAFVVGNDNKAEMRSIKIGQEDNGHAVVLQGLSPGEKVVTAGQYRVQQGALVEPSGVNPASQTENSAQDNPAKAP
jgi:hypothetical protein